MYFATITRVKRTVEPEVGLPTSGTSLRGAGVPTELLTAYFVSVCMSGPFSQRLLQRST